MGDIDDGNTKLSLDFLDFKAHGFTQFGIQVAERFVQQQQLRGGHERTGQGNALLLAAGELVWESAGILAQMDNAQHSLNTALDLSPGSFFDGERVGDIIEHIHVWPYRIALEDHPDAPLFRWHKGLAPRNQPIINIQFSACRLLKACDDAQHRGLSTPGRSQKCDEFSIPECFVKIFQHGVFTE